MKSILKKTAKYFGYEIIQAKNKSKTLEVRTENFDELCHAYEHLFGSKFGELPQNIKRIEIMRSLLGTATPEAYFIVNSINKTRSVEGDICEFGVAQGVTSMLIANEILESGQKHLHFFDSFEGLPKPTEHDTLKDDIFKLGKMEEYEGTMKYPEKMLINNLRSINFPENRYSVHKGFIEDLIVDKDQFPEKVSFAYLDFDFYEPTKLVLEYLDKHTDKGAIVMIDDYDWFSTGIKKVVDSFISDNNERYELYIPDNVFGHFAILTKML
jgi:O-methyltransferase